jgi:ferric-dicitrate binding protein FerR (iron transport regulator)
MDEIRTGAPGEGGAGADEDRLAASGADQPEELRDGRRRVWHLLAAVESPLRYPRPRAEDLIAEAGIRRLPASRTSEPSRGAGPVLKRHLRHISFGAAIGAAAAALGVLVLNENDAPDAPPPPIEYAANPSETNAIRLEDGTEVLLAPGSRLKLDGGSSAVRQVSFEGVGYFSVARDETRPFIIRTAGGTAEVLGTSFELKASGNEVRVVVVEGSVALEADGEKREIRMNQMGHASADHPPTVVEVQDVNEFLTWVDGLLVFQSTPLSRVAERLGEHYGMLVEIQDSALASREVTAWLREQNFDPALTAVCSAVGAICTVSRTGATMRLPP